MKESELLERIMKVGVSGNDILVGPGDDAAVVRTPSGDRFVLTVDQVIEGRHFRRGTPLIAVARKAIARSVSDLAAMCAQPAWCLATGALPEDMSQSDAMTLCDALREHAAKLGCPLVGGDIASVPRGTPLSLTVTAAGFVPPGVTSPLRSDARIGDAVYVTGSIGASFDEITGLGHHLTFTPRVFESHEIYDLARGGLGAMMDVSDGLGRDAARIGRMSNVLIMLNESAIPLRDCARGARRSVADGEDYELLCTVRPEVNLPEFLPRTGTRLTRIGTVVQGAPGAALTGSDGAMFRLDDAGWDHGAR
jgi:thiamine-monophosphate kinase